MSEVGIVLPWLKDGIPRDLEEERAALTIERKRWCPHSRTRLDPESRRVFCRSCGEEVDAFSVLVDIAREGDRLLTNRDHLRNQLASLEEKVAEKQRELRSLQGKIRRRTA